MAIKLPQVKLPELPFLKPKDAIAVDVGTSSVKIAYLKHAGSKYTLLKWGLIPINEGSVDLSPQERKGIVETRVAEYLAKEKIPTKNIVSSVSGNQVIVRYVHLPKLSREELVKTIQFEAEPYIPFDIREVDLGFHVLGDVVEEGQKKMETILVAAKKDVVQSRLEIFNDIGLRMVIMDLDVFALQNAYEINRDHSQNETVLLINIGNSVTNMAIVENGVSKVVRDVYISGGSFTKAIQRNLACDIKTAEDLKSRYSILVTAEEKEKTLSQNQKEALQVSTAMTPVLKDLLGEIQRSIDFFISQNPERSINRVLMCGGSCFVKNLDGFLHQELKIPIEVFNPFKSIAGGEIVPDNSAPLFAVAVGLATRRENDLGK
ncbi:MAG: type IV pilus assembly protein PilM [Endomicrobiales bacterium]|nr:type IV pilus assembly protein PilM [Endomicrobiales bacterium]